MSLTDETRPAVRDGEDLSPGSRAALRAVIRHQVEAFLTAGGEICTVGTGMIRHVSHDWGGMGTLSLNTAQKTKTNKTRH